MKKQLKILLIAFIAAVGISGAVAAQPVATAASGELIINSPGASVVGGNVNSNTSGDAINPIESTTHKSTTNIGVGKSLGNKILI